MMIDRSHACSMRRIWWRPAVQKRSPLRASEPALQFSPDVLTVAVFRILHGLDGVHQGSYGYDKRDESDQGTDDGNDLVVSKPFSLFRGTGGCDSRFERPLGYGRA